MNSESPARPSLLWRVLRLAFLLGIILLGVGLLYHFWSPGLEVVNGAHDLRSNGIWLQHAWLGHDTWFADSRKDRSLFRQRARIQNLATLVKQYGIRYVFPHLCPCSPDGSLPLVDDQQTVQFLEEMDGVAVLPWIGGVLDKHVFLESETWRSTFVTSVLGLLQRHPKLAGIHLNIEPLPNGTPHLLTLLDELRRSMPKDRLISIAAYPPPTFWHPFPEVHWEKSYFQAVASRADQMVPMMYDTSIRVSKVYQRLMAEWTGEVIAWAGATQVLLGIPAYEDGGVGYHDPKVENLTNALCGIHRGLDTKKPLPANYAGVAVYSEWEMAPDEWALLEREFCQQPNRENASAGVSQR